MNMELLLIAETIEDRLLPSHLDLLALAGHFPLPAGSRKGLLLPGNNMAETAKTLSETHGLDIIVLEAEKPDLPNPYRLLEAAREVVKKYAPRFICLPHTMRACQVAAGLAQAFDGACITAVEDIRMENQQLFFRRALFNGKLQMEITPLKTPTVFTILSGAFPFQKARPVLNQGRMEQAIIPRPTARFMPLALVSTEEKDNVVETADVIVAAGRGVGKIENMDLIRELAGIMQNSAVAGSRPVCDLGWLPYSRQIGETGKQVGPKLYLACGISGARQHTMAIKNAQTIMAINTDSQAVIFSVADIGIVEDLTTFLPLLIEKYRQSTQG